jgi:hypothetical protein
MSTTEFEFGMTDDDDDDERLLSTSADGATTIDESVDVTVRRYHLVYAHTHAQSIR